MKFRIYFTQTTVALVATVYMLQMWKEDITEKEIQILITGIWSKWQ